MNDTSPDIEKKVREMFQALDPVERLKMGCAMHDLSKYLVIHAILRHDPYISDAQLRQEVFLRFYEEDFGPSEREKILASLAEWKKPFPLPTDLQQMRRSVLGV